MALFYANLGSILSHFSFLRDQKAPYQQLDRSWGFLQILAASPTPSSKRAASILFPSAVTFLATLVVSPEFRFTKLAKLGIGIIFLVARFARYLSCLSGPREDQSPHRRPIN